MVTLRECAVQNEREASTNSNQYQTKAYKLSKFHQNDNFGLNQTLFWILQNIL